MSLSSGGSAPSGSSGCPSEHRRGLSVLGGLRGTEHFRICSVLLDTFHCRSVCVRRLVQNSLVMLLQRTQVLVLGGT